MRWTLAIALGFVLVGCEKEAPAPEPAAADPTAEAQAPAPVAEAPALTEDDVAVPEDFIEEATTEITAENYAQKLDEIDQEISAARE